MFVWEDNLFSELQNKLLAVTPQKDTGPLKVVGWLEVVTVKSAYVNLLTLQNVAPVDNRLRKVYGELFGGNEIR